MTEWRRSARRGCLRRHGDCRSEERRESKEPETHRSSRCVRQSGAGGTPAQRHIIVQEIDMLLDVNGRRFELDVAPDMPLLWVLRENLGLTGTKFGCGLGQCGACTVHVDGAPVRACTVTASAAAGKAITTIEGLSPDATHALQAAWVDEQVPQCGYCQSDQIMSAAALVARTPRPSDQQIDSAMSGNICRCGTYGRIRRAIHRAARG